MGHALHDRDQSAARQRLNRKVNKKANRRKPGKKELRDLKDEPKLDLLPMVFASG